MIIDNNIYKKVCEITLTNYEPLFEDNHRVLLDHYSIESMFEELINEIDNLQEKYDDLEQDMQDNYRPISRGEYTGDRYDDRY